MPTYDYECEKCGKSFEAFQGMKDPLLKECPDPECGGQVRRLVGAGSGLIFKGSGFYITDYKKKSGSDEKPAAESGGKAESKTETKAEPKTESKTESAAPAKTESKTTPAAAPSGKE